MFTGIAETTGKVLELSRTAGGLCVGIDVSRLRAELHDGDSVAVDGVCLSAVRPSSEKCYFDVIQETLRRTNFGNLRVGQLLNLERSMGPTSCFDGHFVQGHIDALATVDRVTAGPEEWVVWFAHEASITPLVVPKGSIAINGVSMTIAEVTSNQFSVALIPTTLERTNLGKLKAGDHVNIETDILARTILHQLKTGFSDRGPEGLFDQMQRQGYT